MESICCCSSRVSMPLTLKPFDPWLSRYDHGNRFCKHFTSKNMGRLSCVCLLDLLFSECRKKLFFYSKVFYAFCRQGHSHLRHLRNRSILSFFVVLCWLLLTSVSMLNEKDSEGQNHLTRRLTGMLAPCCKAVPVLSMSGHKIFVSSARVCHLLICVHALPMCASMAFIAGDVVGWRCP